MKKLKTVVLMIVLVVLSGCINSLRQGMQHNQGLDIKTPPYKATTQTH